MNVSDKDVTLKIGTSSFFVAKGAKYDYYFSADVKGTLSAEGFEDCFGVNGTTKVTEAIFKPAYAYSINLAKASDSNNTVKYYIQAGSGTTVGKDMSKDKANIDIWTGLTF